MFSKDKHAKTGRQSWCKMCAAECKIERRRNDTTAIADFACTKFWMERNQAKMREYRWKWKHPIDEYADIIPSTN